MTDAMLDALDRLSDAGPEYREILANHGPMAAEALVRLGRAEVVSQWVEQYKRKLAPQPAAVSRIEPDEWQRYLGQPRFVGDWTVLMRRELSERSWLDMLARWWPRLLPGLAASATHGVIRTAHAVRSLADAADDSHPLLVDELARGLAFWAARYQTLPGAPSLAGSVTAVAAVANLPRLDPELDSPEPGIIGRLRLLPLLPSFTSALDNWKTPGDPHLALTELISAAARVVAVREDAPIAYCHTVTGPAAVRMTLSQLPESLWWPSVAATWQVIGGIISAFAAPRLGDESAPAALSEPPTDDTFHSMTELAVAHGDEHVIKLTEAAIREYRISKDQTLLTAAERFRSRVPINT
jgi:hypothetical protein